MLISIFYSRISRLLDRLSDDDADDGRSSHSNLDLGDSEEDEDDVTFEVEDVLVLAMEERRGKKEAERVLSHLQQNYDELQRKYAEAENLIDKYR